MSLGEDLRRAESIRGSVFRVTARVIELVEIIHPDPWLVWFAVSVRSGTFVVVIAVLVVAAAVAGWWLTRSPVSGPDASPSESPQALQSVDLSGVPVARRPFCDALQPDDVRSALGGPERSTAHYVPGQQASLAPGLRDVAHEYDCTFRGAGAEARAWVFAAPVRRPLALSITQDALGRPGCRLVPRAPTFGRPGVTTDCPAAGGAGRTVASRGLFGDAWLTCQLTSRDAEPDVVRRAEQWCVTVATTAGARP